MRFDLFFEKNTVNGKAYYRNVTEDKMESRRMIHEDTSTESDELRGDGNHARIAMYTIIVSSLPSKFTEQLCVKLIT